MTLPRLFLQVFLIARPIFWPSTFLGFLLGVYLNNGVLNIYSIIHALIWTIPYSVFLCSVNDYFDFDSDHQNKLKGGLAGPVSNSRDFLRQLAIASLTFMLIYLLFLPNITTKLLGVVILTISLLYSAPPIRLKGIPIIDFLSNGIVAIAMILQGAYFANPSLTPYVIEIAICFFLGVAAFQILGSLKDYTLDKKLKERTTSVVFGQRPSALIASALFLLASLILMYSNFSPLFFSYTLISSLGCFYLVIFPGEKNTMKTALVLILAFIAAISLYLFLNLSASY